MSDKQAEAKAIIEKAMADLTAIGASPDSAAALLVVQGFIRIRSSAKRAEMVAFVNAGTEPIEPEYQMMVFGE